MTVKELIAILNRIPSDAVIVYGYDRFIVDEVLYDSDEHFVTFAGTDEFGIPSTCNGDCSECHEPCQMNQDIPDDVDETNYNPYTGCDEYEDYPITFDGEDYL